MKTTLLSLEAVSLIVLMMLLYGSVFEINRKLRRNRVYTYSVLSAIAAIAADMTAWGLNGMSEFAVVS